MPTFGIDQDQRSDIPTGLRRTGIFGGKGIFHKYFNQLIFETKQNYIWGTSAQVALGDATVYTDSAGDIFDKNDLNITANLQDDDVILATHDATLAANLKLQPSTAKRLKIGMVKGASIDFGDAGSGVPFKMILGSNIAKGSDVKIRGGFDFRENTLSDEDKRLIANQARGVKVDYNEWNLYDPSRVGDIIEKYTKDTNPYLLEANGQQLDWLADASNTTKAWFRDLNIFDNGIIFDGINWVETRSRFSVSAIPAYRFQLNTQYGFRRQISGDDTRIHSRSDKNGVSVADTAAFVNTSPVVTFTDITDIKNGMRINGASAQGIPDSTSGTTILKNVNTTAKTATMIDALTGADVDATSTVGSIAVTMDNSGAAGGSSDEDYFQGWQAGMDEDDSGAREYWGRSGARDDTISVAGLANTTVPVYQTTVQGDSQMIKAKNDGTNGDPRILDQTQPQSTGVIVYQHP